MLTLRRHGHQPQLEDSTMTTETEALRAGALPPDFARCEGRIATSPSVFGTVTIGQSACVRCLRRTSPPGDQHMVPPEFKDGQCPERIGAPS